jgi:transcription elongation factor SPT5
MGAPTPGASGAGAPTPGVYGAPTPGNYSAPTPSFARTPGVAATPFVPGGVADAAPPSVFSKHVPFDL